MIRNDLEACVLSCAIMHDKLNFVVEQLKAEDFTDSEAKYIFDKIKGLFEQRIPIDPVTLFIDENIEIETYQTVLNRLPTGASYQYYINQLLEKSRLRKMRAIGEQLVREAIDENNSIEVINAIQSELNHMIYDKDGFNTIGEIIEETEKPVGISFTTGFYDYDKRMGGLTGADLIVIGARPSMGKTALAMSIMLSMMKAGIRVGFFSLEMSLKQIGQRLISMHSEIPHESIKLKTIPEQDLYRYKETIAELRKTNIMINDKCGLNVYEIKSQVRQLFNEGKIDIVFIDYLQLIYGTGTEPSREREVNFIVQELKNLAKELDIPIVLLSQLNRATESRANNKPKLSDLRESGSIEQVADVVILLYREYYYTQKMEHIDENYMLIEKNRNGPTGSVKMIFNSDIVKFEGIKWNA